MPSFDSLKSAAKSAEGKLEAVKPSELKAQLEQAAKKYEDELKDISEIPDITARNRFGELKAKIAKTRNFFLARALLNS